MRGALGQGERTTLGVAARRPVGRWGPQAPPLECERRVILGSGRVIGTTQEARASPLPGFASTPGTPHRGGSLA